MEETSPQKVELADDNEDIHQNKKDIPDGENGVKDHSPQPDDHNQNGLHQDKKKETPKTEGDSNEAAVTSDENRAQSVEPKIKGTTPEPADQDRKVKPKTEESITDSDNHGQKVKLETQDNPINPEQSPSFNTSWSSITDRAMPCRRCFDLRLEDPKIKCCTRTGRKGCVACIEGRRKCVRIPEELKDELLQFLLIQDPEQAKIQHKALKKSISSLISSDTATPPAGPQKRKNESTSQNPRPTKAARTSNSRTPARNGGRTTPGDPGENSLTMEEIRVQVLELLNQFRSEIQSFTGCLEELGTETHIEDLPSQE